MFSRHCKNFIQNGKLIIFFFPFLMFTILNQSISNDKQKVGCQSFNYKRDTWLTIPCYVNKDRVMFLFTY